MTQSGRLPADSEPGRTRRMRCSHIPPGNGSSATRKTPVSAATSPGVARHSTISAHRRNSAAPSTNGLSAAFAGINADAIASALRAFASFSAFLLSRSFAAKPVFPVYSLPLYGKPQHASPQRRPLALPIHGWDHGESRMLNQTYRLESCKEGRKSAGPVEFARYATAFRARAP
jgi:hypothetical protein